MLRRLKLAPRLALWIVVGTGLILTSVIVSDYYSARRMLEEELRSRVENLALATARDMEVIKKAVEKVVLQLGVSLHTQPLSLEELYSLLENTLKEHGELYGSAVALDPFVRKEGTGPEIPYVYRQGGKLVRKNLAGGGYRFDTFDWYSIPRELRKPVWTEPYFDEGGGESLMVTYSVPVFMGPEERPAGIITGDLSLEWLTGMLAKMDLGAGGYAMVLSRNGTVISHPRQQVIMRESIFSFAEQHDAPGARLVGRSMVRGESGFVEFKGFEDPRLFWLAYTPIPDTGWTLGALFPQDVITAKLAALSRQSSLLGGVGALAMLLVALVIASNISRPLRQLSSATRLLAGGDLEAPLPAPRGEDEVAQLAASFAAMRGDLKKHIEDLRATTAAKSRIEGELEAARKIQLDLLPSRFAFDPPRREVELHALIEPARMVGGDFYDFFLTGNGKLFLAVGDVSGKGIAAALFMSLSKAFLKAFAGQGLDPSEAVSRLNDELAIENDEGMFLTAFACLIDLESGEAVYANGGHNPPFVRRASGDVEAVPTVQGPLIGLDGGKKFESGRLQLRPGDVLLAYSDGVVEAENPAEELFGEERLTEALARGRGLAPRDLLAAIREEVLRFTAGAPQSDDITLLGVAYRG